MGTRWPRSAPPTPGTSMDGRCNGGLLVNTPARSDRGRPFAEQDLKNDDAAIERVHRERRLRAGGILGTVQVSDAVRARGVPRIRWTVLASG